MDISEFAFWSLFTVAFYQLAHAWVVGRIEQIGRSGRI